MLKYEHLSSFDLDMILFDRLEPFRIVDYASVYDCKALMYFPYFSTFERRKSLFTTVTDHVRYSVVAIFDECVFVYKLPTFVHRK